MKPVDPQERECTRKRRYPDHVEALAFAAHRMENGEPPLKVYRCRFCGGYHLAKDRAALRAQRMT